MAWGKKKKEEAKPAAVEAPAPPTPPSSKVEHIEGTTVVSVSRRWRRFND